MILHAVVKCHFNMKWPVDLVCIAVYCQQSEHEHSHWRSEKCLEQDLADSKIADLVAQHNESSEGTHLTPAASGCVLFHSC